MTDSFLLRGDALKGQAGTGRKAPGRANPQRRVSVEAVSRGKALGNPAAPPSLCAHQLVGLPGLRRFPVVARHPRAPLTFPPAPASACEHGDPSRWS